MTSSGTPIARNCSYWQDRWLRDAGEPAASANVYVGLRFKGAFDEDALVRTLASMVERHEALRTTFEYKGRGEWQQLVWPRGGADIVTFAQPSAERAAPESPEIVGFVDRPLDLRCGELVRVGLSRLSRTEHIFLIVMHHAIVDGWSAALLGQEISDEYACHLLHRPHRPACIQRTASEFADAEPRDLIGGALRRYWESVLTRSPSRVPPLGQAEWGRDLKSFACERTIISADVMQGLLTRTLRLRTILMTAFATATAQALAPHCGNVVTLGIVHNMCRSSPEWRQTVGLLVDVLPLRLKVREGCSLDDLLAGTRDAWHQALAHRTSFAALHQLLTYGDGHGFPCCEVQLNYLSFDAISRRSRPSQLLPESQSISPVVIPMAVRAMSVRTHEPAPIVVNLLPTACGGLVADVLWLKGLVTREVVRRFVDDFAGALHRLAGDSEGHVP